MASVCCIHPADARHAYFGFFLPLFQVKVVGTLSARPDVTVFSISKDDAFVIVATDGFWDVMTNQEACDYVVR